MKTVTCTMMTRRSLLISCCVLHTSFCASFGTAENNPAKPAAPVAPAAFPSSRYEKMMKKSPFAPATPAATPAVTSATFANYYITGVAKITENGVEKDFVTIQSRGDAQARFSLVTGEPSTDGFTLVKVELSDEVGKSKVTVKKDNETGVLEFDQANVQRNAAVAGVPQPGVAQPAAVSNQLQPATPRMPGAMQPRLAQPFNAANPANNRPSSQPPGLPGGPVVPMPPQSQGIQVNPAGGAQPGQPPQIRRRRTIISAQPGQQQ